MPSPLRIVSLQPSATSILARVGRLDRVVACTKWCRDVCPELIERGVPVVADSWTAQAQQIMAAAPDLVIASVPYQLEAVAEILKAGVRFLGLAPRSLADVYVDIAMIAGVVDAKNEGERLILEMQREIERVRATASAGGSPASTQSRRPRVFCEEWGKPLIASQPWVKELVEAAGGEFIGEAGKTTMADAVRAAAPDVVIAAWCGAGDRVPLEKIVRERGWQDLPAVRARRVYCIRDEFLNTPGPTLIHGLHALAAAIHPERFSAAQGLRQIQT